MKIDCHTHIGKNNHVNASVDDLLKSMDAAGIDKSLVFAGRLNACSNEYMLEQIASHKDRLFGVAAAHPRYFKSKDDLLKEVFSIKEWYMDGLIVACKFYTGYDHYFPQDEIAREYLAQLEPVGCPAIFHSGDCVNTAHKAKLKYAHPLHIDEVAVDYPGINFIIAHLGYPFHKDAAEVCYKNKNVFTDISGFVYGGFSLKDINHFSSVLSEFKEIAGDDAFENKLLFGSDWPISNQSEYVSVINNILFDFNALSASRILTDKIFEQNPKKVFTI